MLYMLKISCRPFLGKVPTFFQKDRHLSRGRLGAFRYTVLFTAETKGERDHLTAV
jgi:hypothetical protein